jgi:hypothetical protein
MVIESGLKYWVSLRQTGILYPELINTFDPIMFHVPVDGVFEWITAKDSGVLLANVCDDNIHEDFWRRIYNIGGGKGYRITNYEFMKKCYEALDVNDFTLYTNLNWFATGNFHGQWYTDSDILEDYFHFRTGTIDDFIKEIKNNLSIISRITKYIPSFIIKKFAMKPLANRELGTMNWINNNKKEHINAYYGSKKKWEEIPNWKNYLPTEPDPTPVRLNHGYNENKPVSELNLNDICEAAVFRGGKCMSDKMKEGDLFTKLKWKCAFDHEFEASPALVLLGGHWCPHCLPAPWNYDEEAKRNPFFAQVWDPLHH